MCFDGGTQTTSQTYRPDSHIKNAAYWALRNSWNLAKRGYDIPTRQIAGFNPYQWQALNAFRRDYNIAQPAYRRAGQLTDASATPITEGQINNYLNPWANYALAGLNEDIGVQNRNLSGNLAQATGGVGADRIAVGMAEKSRTDQLARGQLMGNFWGGALTAAQQDKMRQAQAGNAWMNIGSGRQTAALQGDQALFGAGAAKQGLDQSRLDAAYSAALANIEAPWKANQYLTSTISGLAPALGGTTTNTYPGQSQWPMVAGLGLAAMGLPQSSIFGGMMGFGGAGAGNPWGAPMSLSPSGGGFFPWGGQSRQYADGGRIDENEYSEGGAVNPFDFGEGFALGGAPEYLYSPKSIPTWADATIGFDPVTAPVFPAPADQSAAWVQPGVAAMTGAASSWPNIDGNNEPPPLPPSPDRSSNPYFMPDPSIAQRAQPTPQEVEAVVKPSVRPTASAFPPSPVTGPPINRMPPSAISQAPSLEHFMPRQVKTGNIGDRLLEAGLTILAHSGDRDARGLPLGPFAAIGKGGLAALEGRRKDVAEDQKTLAIEQKAKDLLENAQKWRAGIAESARYHDLTADWREAVKSGAVSKVVNGTWKDESGNPVKGVVIYKKDGSIEHRPGESIEGLGGDRSTGQERDVRRIMDDAKDAGNPITYTQALDIYKRGGGDRDLMRKETIATQRANAEYRALIESGLPATGKYEPILDKHRKRLGLE